MKNLGITYLLKLPHLISSYYSLWLYIEVCMWFRLQNIILCFFLVLTLGISIATHLVFSTSDYELLLTREVYFWIYDCECWMRFVLKSPSDFRPNLAKTVWLCYTVPSYDFQCCSTLKIQLYANKTCLNDNIFSWTTNVSRQSTNTVILY